MAKLLINSAKHGIVHFIIDDEDLPKVIKFKWFVLNCRNKKYIHCHSTTDKHRKTIRLHRLITNAPSNLVVDHINGDTLDNRKANLRICTNKENCWNQSLRKNNKTGFKGVLIEKRNLLSPYYSTIRIGNSRKYLGAFKTPIEAAKAYNEAALKYHGEFANLNLV